MKKAVALKELPQNLSLEEAEPDMFHSEDTFDLDFELEELESRLALVCPYVAHCPASCPPEDDICPLA